MKQPFVVKLLQSFGSRARPGRTNLEGGGGARSNASIIHESSWPFLSYNQTNPMASTSTIGSMPSKTADLEETWAYLSNGVDLIMNRLETGLSFPDYSSLYSTVYNYCTSTKLAGRQDGNRSR